jgi:hypothetical protein
MLDRMEKDPDADPTDLAWVVKLLQISREEEEKAKALRLRRIEYL